MKGLPTDPDARVMVFIDGQNLYKRCQQLFGYPLCHPRMLANELAGPRTNQEPSVRLYSGRPNPNIDEDEKRKAGALPLP